MDFWMKVEQFKEDMKARGGWWGLRNAVPPYLSLAWMLRIKARPPYFLSFLRSAITAGGWFTVAWGLGVWLFVNRPDGGPPAWASALEAVLAGALFGLAMAWYWRSKARVLRLPSWEQYPQG